LQNRAQIRLHFLDAMVGPQQAGQLRQYGQVISVRLSNYHSISPLFLHFITGFRPRKDFFIQGRK
jgi:hypothetical protein